MLLCLIELVIGPLDFHVEKKRLFAATSHFPQKPSKVHCNSKYELSNTKALRQKHGISSCPGSRRRLVSRHKHKPKGKDLTEWAIFNKNFSSSKDTLKGKKMGSKVGEEIET